MRDWEQALRDSGHRVTAARGQVLDAVTRLRHATPEQVCEATPDVDDSTVYRSLEVLAGVGLITHTHIGHGPPTYHAVDPHPHLHLICQSCGRQESADMELAAPLVDRLQRDHGFTAQLAYFALPGLCRDCGSKADTGALD